MKYVRVALLGSLVVLTVGYGITAGILTAFRPQLEDRYLRVLDRWATSGAVMNNFQQQVVATCGKFVVADAGWFERLELSTFYRSEFDFRVNVCVKMTANKVYPQPEFSNVALVTMICENPGPEHQLFGKLCRRDGLPARKP